jgi:hypothetical protein
MVRVLRRRSGKEVLPFTMAQVKCCRTFRDSVVFFSSRYKMFSLEISTLQDETTTLSQNAGHHTPGDAAPHYLQLKTSNFIIMFSDNKRCITNKQFCM